MIYLASPYTHADQKIQAARYEAVAALTASLIRAGTIVYSPIVNFHYLSREYYLPTDFTFWKDYNLRFLGRCDELYIFTLPGWDISKGVTAERDFARTRHIPAFFIDAAAQVTPCE